MDQVRDRLHQALKTSVWRLRHPGGAASEDGAMAGAKQTSIRASYLPSEDDRDVRVPGTLRAAASF